MAANPETMDRLARVVRTTLKLDNDVQLSRDMPLVGGEFDLDSLDVLLLITNVEREFSICIRDGAIDRSAFKTLATFGDHIERLRSTA
jgi:acyl carrier protein